MYSRSSEPVRFERDCPAVLVPQGDHVTLPIVDLGLVYEASVDHRDDGGRVVTVRMTLTAPGCGMGDILVDDVRSKLEMIPTVAETDVELVFDPPWNQSMMSDAARLETGMF